MRLIQHCLVLLACSLHLVACSSAGGSDDRDFSQITVQSSGNPPASKDKSGDPGGKGDGTLCDPPTAPDAQGGPAGQGGSSNDAAVGTTAPDAQPACNYPTGSYGTSVGNVLSSAIKWTGYEPGASSPTTVSVSKFLDCDGTAGINAVLFVHGNVDCPACQNEAQGMPGKMQTWGPAGVVVVYLLLDDASQGAPTAQTAKLWRDQFGLDSIYVVADPMFALQSPLANAIPYEVLVDPRTMKIVDIYIGGVDDDKVLSLANQNKP